MKGIEIVVHTSDLKTNAFGNINVSADASLISNGEVRKDDMADKVPGERDKFVETEMDCVDGYVSEIPGQGGFDRLQSDVRFRHRFLHTACVFWSMVAMGWRVGLTGPTFPDLRQIINEDLSKSSWIFTAVSLGGLIGSVFSGLAYDRFNKLVVFALIDLGLAVTAAVTPWCSNFPLMFTAHLLHGGFVSALDTAATSDVIHVWNKQGGPYMQAVHFGFSLGAIISPFVSEPFLAKRLSHEEQGFRTSNVSGISDYGKGMTEMFENVTSTLAERDGAVTQSAVNKIYDTSDVLPYVLEYGETKIHVPYLISAVVSLSAMFSFIVLYLFMGSVYKKSVSSKATMAKTTEEKTERHLLSKRLKLLFTILLATLLLTSVMNERHFRDFLMTFSISSLGWSKTRGSNVTATFWIAFAVGRLSGVITVRCMRQTLVFILYIGILTAGTVALWISVKFNVDVLVFVSTGVIGVGMSVLFASCFSWLSENILTVTGKMTSVMFIVFSSGAMTFPVLAGYLMKNYDLRWFVYLQLILVVIINVILITVIVAYSCVSRRKRS